MGIVSTEMNEGCYYGSIDQSGSGEISLILKVSVSSRMRIEASRRHLTTRQLKEDEKAPIQIYSSLSFHPIATITERNDDSYFVLLSFELIVEESLVRTSYLYFRRFAPSVLVLSSSRYVRVGT